MEAHRDPEFQKVLNSADLFCSDGIAPGLLSQLNGDALPERVPGADLLAAFLSKADKSGYSSCFFGDTDETLAALKESAQKAYPGHRVAGVLSSPFRKMSAAEDAEIIEEINRARPDVLWVGMGTPKQDWWIYNHQNQLRISVVAGVGAAFRFWSGSVKRAPSSSATAASSGCGGLRRGTTQALASRFYRRSAISRVRTCSNNEHAESIRFNRSLPTNQCRPTLAG